MEHCFFDYTSTSLETRIGYRFHELTRIRSPDRIWVVFAEYMQVLSNLGWHFDTDYRYNLVLFSTCVNLV